MGDELKRVFSVLLAMLILSGCGGKSTRIEPVTKGISFSCEITYYNETYECDCEVQKNGEAIFEFKYPTEIEGLRFLFSKNGVSVKYNEIEYINENITFENTAAHLIWDVLANVNGKAISENDVFFIEGESKEYDYRLELGSTGLPIKLKTNPDIIEVTFKNVKIK